MFKLLIFSILIISVKSNPAPGSVTVTFDSISNLQKTNSTQDVATIQHSLPDTNQPQLPTTLPDTNQPQLSTTLPDTNQPQLPTTLPDTNQPQLPTTLPDTNQTQVTTAQPSVPESSPSSEVKTDDLMEIFKHLDKQIQNFYVLPFTLQILISSVLNILFWCLLPKIPFFSKFIINPLVREIKLLSNIEMQPLRV